VPPLSPLAQLPNENFNFSHFPDFPACKSFVFTNRIFAA
jgi:hypothetical protein